MIASLRGRLTDKQAPLVVVECQGVGYELETPMSTFLELPALGEDVFLHTHMVVREDAQLLYGFATDAERALFRTVLKISGVGAKMGLAILSSMDEADFRRCVEYEDTSSLVKIPGVGKKTAERLIVEMRDKFKDGPSSGAVRGKVTAPASPKSEAVDALVALGYKVNEVNKLLGGLATDEMSAEAIIRQALQQAAR